MEATTPVISCLPCERWAGLCVTRRGASHISSGLPNQDRGLIYPPDCNQLPIVLAVADGHGSERYTRSDRGSRFAVEVANRRLQDFAEDWRNEGPGKIDACSARLAQDIVQDWRLKVEKDVERDPFGESDNPKTIYEPYGSTLLAALVTEKWILLLQLGDGAIILRGNEGEPWMPIPHDPRLFAGQTWSMCHSDAADYFGRLVLPMGEKSIETVVLTTDGYVDCFPDDPDKILNNVKKIEQGLREKGCHALEPMLEQAFDELTRIASGDDITMSILIGLRERDQDFKDRSIQNAVRTLHSVSLTVQQVADQQEAICSEFHSSIDGVARSLDRLELLMGRMEGNFAASKAVASANTRSSEQVSARKVGRWFISLATISIAMSLLTIAAFLLGAPKPETPSRRVESPRIQIPIKGETFGPFKPTDGKSN